MTRKRKAASAAFKVPLTKYEDAINKHLPPPTVVLKGQVIRCSSCGLSGGTLIKIDENLYKHEVCRRQDARK